MRTWSVGIVGGGPGGLMTAYSLQEMADRPVRITLYEASTRLGGKILTPQFAAAPVRYEAGAAEFYDYSLFDEDPLKDLITKLGLPVSPMGGSAVIMNDHILGNLDDVRDRLGPNALKSLIAFDRAAKDSMTPEEFYHSDFPDGAPVGAETGRFDSLLTRVAEPGARAFIETMIHSDMATEPEHTTPSYGLQNYLMNDPAYMRLYGIDGGNERLPIELAARIHATVLREHPVARVGGSEDGRLRIVSTHRGTSRRDDFDFVVVALPHAQVPSVTFEGDRLAEAVRRHQAYYDHPAHYLRITILFERPFWRAALTDSYWMLDRFGGCCLYDESSREPGGTHGVLGWLVGGSEAQRMSEMDDDNLIASALDSLPSFLARGRALFVEGRVHRWVGAVNAIPGGVVPLNLDLRHRPEPAEHPRLFLVGDYLFDSTLNGALDSAEYVAAWIAALILDDSERPA